MAVLDNTNRVAIWQKVMALWSNRRESLGVLTKAELQLAVNAVDDWAESNASAFNLAIPLPARTALTASQKAVLLAYVCLRRAGEG